MLKLYGGARSRATLIQWYLKELEVPFEYVLLDMQTGEHLKSDFLAINPFGKVPAIVDGDLKLWESGAILLYLQEKYDPQPASLEQRAEFTQWILFANATLGPGLFVEASRERETPRLLTPLQERLAQHPFMLGETFTVVDVGVGSYLWYATLMLQLNYEGYPEIAAYTQRLAKRPAFQATMGQR